MPYRTWSSELQSRFDSHAYRTLTETRPWRSMFLNRHRRLQFYRLSDLGDGAPVALARIICFMEDYSREMWERTYWITFPTNSPEYRDRKGRMDRMMSARVQLVSDIGQLGFNSDWWYEPGLWVLPDYPCYWILEPPETGRSYADQLLDLDRREPSRAQFTVAEGRTAFLEVRPLTGILQSRLPEPERVMIPVPSGPGGIPSLTPLSRDAQSAQSSGSTILPLPDSASTLPSTAGSGSASGSGSGVSAQHSQGPQDDASVGHGAAGGSQPGPSSDGRSPADTQHHAPEQPSQVANPPGAESEMGGSD
jgi:hypothetical protein